MTKKAQINMSLIPLVLILAVILGAGYFLVQGDIKFPSFDDTPQINRLDGFPTVIYTDEDLEKERKVIRTQEELAEFLNMIDKTGLTQLREQVSYDKEFLLAVSSESEMQVGHTLKIKKVYINDEDNLLTVQIEETFPGKTCELEEDKHIAVDIVSISQTEHEIRFDRIKKIEECN
jgi:hypothetical protein